METGEDPAFGVLARIAASAFRFRFKYFSLLLRLIIKWRDLKLASLAALRNGFKGDDGGVSASSKGDGVRDARAATSSESSKPAAPTEMAFCLPGFGSATSWWIAQRPYWDTVAKQPVILQDLFMRPSARSAAGSATVTCCCCIAAS